MLINLCIILLIISSCLGNFEGEINQKNPPAIRVAGFSPSFDDRKAQDMNSVLMGDQMKVTLYEHSRTVSHISPPPPPPLTAVLPPPPPAYFTGYTLPPGNPCETFTLPPPPADKKKTGPRRKLKSL